MTQSHRPWQRRKYAEGSLTQGLPLRRLTKLQVENTVVDAINRLAGQSASEVLKVAQPLLKKWPEDRYTSIRDKGRDGFFRADHATSQQHADAPVALAIALGKALTDTEAKRRAVVGDYATDSNTRNDVLCVDAFVRDKGSIILRGAISDDDVTFYRKAMRGTVASAEALADVLGLLFASPRAFFHVEADDSNKLLSPMELAGRLSFQDVLVAGLACGLTRVVSQFHQGWSTTFGRKCEDPWHQDVSHQVQLAAPHEEMAASLRLQFSEVIVPVVAKLDAISDDSGGTLLNKCLVYWTQEHGVFSHAQENIPVVTFGSANGAFAAGVHLDYRDQNRIIPKRQFGDTPADRPYVGLTYHHLLASIAQGFGIPRSEWAESNHAGYGIRPSNLATASYGDRYKHWGTQEGNAAGDKLPWWVA